MKSPKLRAVKRKVESSVKEKTKKSAKLIDNPQEQLVLEHEELKKKYKMLLMQNKSNVEKISSLKNKVSKLEEKKKPPKVSTQSQTTMECEYCNYPPKDLVDLGEHQYQCHGPDDESDDEPIVCYICGWKVDSKEGLMKHRQEKHEHQVRTCQYFLQGACDFSAEDCWYRHETPKTQHIKVFKCSICDETFGHKADFMKHRKIKHKENVSICHKNMSGSCHFGAEKCWFTHTNEEINIEEINKESPNFMARIFDMMEKFNERFELIENQL